MQIRIDADSANQRFDRFLRKFLKKYPQVSLTDIYKGLRTGTVKINAKKAKENYKLQEGDVIEFREGFEMGQYKPQAAKSVKQHRKERINRDHIKQRIIYEDEEWLVRNKPAGVVMHESNQHWNDLSMQDYLAAYLGEFGGAEINSAEHDSFRPSFGYRLDKDTSGVLIAGKTYNALQYINKIIRERAVKKVYKTIVVGQFPQHMLLNKPLHKWYDEKFGTARVEVSRKGKEAMTECWLEKVAYDDNLGQISLVKVQISTGRMHQIRVHLADAGYPVLGDMQYGKPMINRKLFKIAGIKRHLLHCREYSFIDHHAKKRSFQAPLPQEFAYCI
jgi:23S rRNA pseudouridine955/2504/2580 synthase